MVTMHYPKLKYSGSTKPVQRAENVWRTNPTLEDFKLQKLKKSWRMWELLFTRSLTNIKNDYQLGKCKPLHCSQDFTARIGHVESVKSVPKNLLIDQVENRKNVCLDLLTCIESDPKFVKNLISDKTWIFLFWQGEKMPKSRMALSILTAHPKKQERAHQKSSTCSFVFLTVKNLCFKSKLRIKHLYCGILERLHRVVHVWPTIANTWILHHVKAHCCTALSVTQFLT